MVKTMLFVLLSNGSYLEMPNAKVPLEEKPHFCIAEMGVEKNVNIRGKHQVWNFSCLTQERKWVHFTTRRGYKI